MVDQMFTVRPACKKDIEPLKGLLQDLFQIEDDFVPNAALQEAGLRQLLNQAGAIILVAEHQGAVVGMCSVQTVVSTAEGGPTGILEDMVVTRYARRQGVGKAILRTAEGWAAEHGLTRLQLLVEANNDAAVSFYRKMGWQRTGLVCCRKLLV